jgi:hypothetical protein
MNPSHPRYLPERRVSPRHVFRILLFAWLALCPALAQSTSGVVSGLVLDPSGRPIFGADVEMVNDATGVRYPGATNSEGIYEIPNLPPGAYRLQVAKAGFKTLIKPDIVLHTEGALAINFTLPLGATSETITVEGGAPLLQTESATVSTVIDQQMIENLPLNGRSFNTLLQLTPGVVIAPVSSGATSSAPGQFSISGQRTDANSFTVDGVSANFGVSTNGLYSGESGTGSDQAFSALGGTSSLVSVEALQEFRIETSSFAPEFGTTPGGQVMMTTRSGTNDLHGGVYEYFRNNVMDANDWFANHAGQPRAPERHNDFGSYLGGPLWRDRSFFFFSYEGARLRLPQTSVTAVPYLAGSCAPPAGVAPYLEAFPTPNGAVSASTCTGQFTGGYSNAASLDATSLRLDQNLNTRFSLFGRYNYAPSTTVSRVYSLSEIETTPVNTETLTLGLNMALNVRVANTLRGNYSSQSSNLIDTLDAFHGSTPPAPGLLLGTLPSGENDGAFETFDTNYYDFGPLGRNRTRQLNFVDDLTLGWRNHQFKFGADYRGIFLDKVPYSHSVFLIAPSVIDLESSQAAELFTSTRQPTYLLSQSSSLYAQDIWKIHRHLTLTYGVRWELAPAPSPRNQTRLASWTNVEDPAQIALAPLGAPLWATTWTNFAPRFGVAWQPGKKSGLVLRAGIGLFYDLGVGSVADVGSFFPGSATLVTPTVAVPVASPGSYLPALSLAAPYPTVEAFDPALALPRSWEWNLAMEKSLGHQVVTATYVGQHGASLLRQQAQYQPNSNFTSDFLLNGNFAWANYNALQLQYRRQAGPLQALANYTWSHSLDNASNDVVAGFSGNVISAATDYASSDTDVRSSFSGAINYALPGMRDTGFLSRTTRNWSLSGVCVARTGLPFNGVVYFESPDPSGTALSRPDRVSGLPLWIPDPAAGGGRSLNPNALIAPSTPRQGSEGRNDIPGFGLTQVDLSLQRKFQMSERVTLAFRADAFNSLNHPNFTNPPADVEFGPSFLVSQEMLNSGLGGLNPLFQEGGPRSLQLSLRLDF